MSASPEAGPPALERIAVVGAGTMGAGIAQLAALAGFETHLHDPDPEALRGGAEAIERGLVKGSERGRWSPDDAEAARGRIESGSELDRIADAELVVEAAPEDLELKRELLGRASELCAKDALLATNTSSLSVTAIAAGSPNPERVIGMHFFNPPPLMELVEVVSTAETSPRARAKGCEVARRMGRTPIVVGDEIGFLANRLARPYSLEALRILGECSASAEEIDAEMRSFEFKMGPFELIDLVGVDVNFAVAKSFWERSFHEPRWQPHPIQQRLVDAGRLGRKSGRGFYRYSERGERLQAGEDDVQPITDAEVEPDLGGVAGRIIAQLVNEAHFAVAAGVGTEADADTATRLGLNWPKGPFEWERQLSADVVVGILEELWRSRREERYRICPRLAARAGS